ncbi:MAG: transposase [Deltaproteobacteria bacterium]|nr:transposase [Deltaproteobacteria bacterium]
MPRHRRDCPAGTLQHIIVRFIDRRFQLATAADRSAYLRIFGRTAERCDWRFLSFALMSNHIHWCALTGRMSLRDIFHPVNTRFGMLWNRRHRGLGPIIAGRPANFPVQAERVVELIAYNHMDPVRNGVVTDPKSSRWTSHRAYVGLDPEPAWLDVDLGLRLGGFPATPAGRRAFDAFVCSNERLHWHYAAELRPRSSCGASFGEAHATLVDEEMLIRLVLERSGISRDLLVGCSRVRRVAHARRLLAHLLQDVAGLGPAAIARHLSCTRAACAKMLAAHVCASELDALRSAAREASLAVK